MKDKVYVTQDISPLIGRMLRKLTAFEKADVMFASEMLIGKRSRDLPQLIYDYAPTLVITRNHMVARVIAQLENQPKVVLMYTGEHDTNEKFWSNAYYLDAFLNSAEKVFEIH